MNAKERKFVAIVYDFYKQKGRHDLVWRKTKNPYNIAVSEVMLQQTQVARVKEKYKEFLVLFPTTQSLAGAPLVAVLKVWVGLGYNRRARFLKQMAEVVVNERDGKFPKNIVDLQGLPGVGHYTARAVATFAYNQPHVFIETNIRTVYMHHFFPKVKTLLDDKVLLSIIQKTLDSQHPREWYWALMDYGSYLKSTGIKIHRNSKQYKKQSTFVGSIREVRGAIIKILTKGALTKNMLQKGILFDDARFEIALEQLVAEKLLEKKSQKYQIAQ